MLSIFFLLIAVPGILASDQDFNEEDEDEDPIVEDINKVDRSALPVVSRETRQSSQHQCEFLKEELITYSYEALTKSGGRREIYLGEVVQLPAETIRTKYENPLYPGLVAHMLDIPYLNCFEQDQQTLVEQVKKLIVKPSTEEYNFKDLEANINGEVGHPEEADSLVFGGELKNGFFIEAGSSDSEKFSDTLYFEINHGWTGLLVEPHPFLYTLGLEKKRKASSINTCLSTQTKPQRVSFDLESVWGEGESMGGIVTDGRNNTEQMQCLPLYSILLAMGNPTVNYFSLDIEGAEFEVLKTVPWDKVDIQVLTVETHMLGTVFPGTRDELIDYMASVGYTHVEGAHKGTNEIRQELGTTDDMFVKNGIQLKKSKEEL